MPALSVQAGTATGTAADRSSEAAAASASSDVRATRTPSKRSFRVGACHSVTNRWMTSLACAAGSVAWAPRASAR